MNWFIFFINSIKNTLNVTATNINDLSTSINNLEFSKDATILDVVGNLHYIAGDIIWYELCLIFVICITYACISVVIAILRIVKDVKQTALF